MTYDIVGRGIYHALRANPDCAFAADYAHILREAYPHYIAELASAIVMLDHKEVDTTYLERKINYLKIFGLLEPENPRIPREIGVTYLDMGLSLSALERTTVNLFRAEKYLRQALSLDETDVVTRHHLGEAWYLLGRYGDSAACWQGILPQLPPAEGEKLEARLKAMAAGRTPRVPPADYLAAVGVAFDCHQRQDFEEAAAILHDVLADEVFCQEYPLPEIHALLGICYQHLGMRGEAENSLKEALRLDPHNTSATEALKTL